MGPVQHTDIRCNRTIKFVWSGDANNNTEEEGDDKQGESEAKADRSRQAEGSPESRSEAATRIFVQ